MAGMLSGRFIPRRLKTEVAMFLTKDELQELTHYKMPHRQKHALMVMGIQYKERPDGSLAVLRAHAEAEMGAATSPHKTDNFEPNWGAI
jgi:hypothetical protein